MWVPGVGPPQNCQGERDAVPLLPLTTQIPSLCHLRWQARNKGKGRGHLALRQRDAVPLLPLLNSYVSHMFIWSASRHYGLAATKVDSGPKSFIYDVKIRRDSKAVCCLRLVSTIV